ncbi:MAG: Hsp20/alpha crystallin family protein [Desulfobacteraceae bacterium]|nr:Hsp20/alpha crystallin family protein [Desulfobacteraceae bacterium]
MFELTPFRRRERGLVASGAGVPDLFREMEERMRRLREEFPLMGAPGELMEWGPRVDVSETEDEVRVKAELPGLAPDDLDISLDRDRLILKGEKKEEREKEEKGYYLSERSFGSFYRAIQLPAEVNPQKVEASFKNGVLDIKMGKQEEAKKRVTHIKVS